MPNADETEFSFDLRLFALCVLSSVFQIVACRTFIGRCGRCSVWVLPIDVGEAGFFSLFQVSKCTDA